MVVALAAGVVGAQDKPLKVGVTAGPHAQITEVARKVAERDGLKIQIVEFTDFIQPNAALNNRELDANIYQHVPFLENQNRARGYKLVKIADGVVQQMGVYSKKVKSLSELPEGARVGIPNDPTNGARALLVLADQGLIRLKPGVGVSASVLDVVANPKKIRLVELEAAQLPRSLEDLDAAAVNTNYAIPAGLHPNRDAIALEQPNSPFAVVVIASRDENKGDPAIAKLVKAYRSDEVKQFVNATFKGAYTTSW
jgi:D-methionine transport system substrate-binding protein